MLTYDVAVLGAGPGGYVAAIRAAKRGAKTCVIEADKVGGVCLNVGCIPTKAMLHAGEVFSHIARSPEYGFVGAGKPTVDGAAYMKRVAGVVDGISKSVERLVKSRKVDLIRGRGKLTARDTLEVAGPDGARQIKAKSIIIATGARPARPGFLPFDSGRVWTTDEATTAKTLPESVLIIGGGVIGCEFATVYAELGIPTTVVEMLDRLVANVDEDAAKAIHKSLEQRGAKVRTKAKIVGLKAAKSGVAAELEGGEKIQAALALAAVGRLPNVEDIGLETVGVKLDGKIIRVDDRCRTNIEGIYAIGDCAEARQYAHLASRMGVVAADNATGHASRDPRTVVPVGIYTHPEVATVGLSEAEAAASGKKVRVARFFYQGSGMARAYGDTEGQVKLIADETLGEVLGGVVIGQHATDVIQPIALAMRNELTVDELAETIHPHPTFVEGVMEAAESWLGYPIHAAG
ncbi:MAG: dihydrolipoyl dehydrogenase [Planctomycetes bacterium]|nr:dihydrolipoyl dehydrogenase [Planctomycetota bacterium]